MENCYVLKRPSASVSMVWKYGNGNMVREWISLCWVRDGNMDGDGVVCVVGDNFVGIVGMSCDSDYSVVYDQHGMYGCINVGGALFDGGYNSPARRQCRGCPKFSSE